MSELVEKYKEALEKQLGITTRDLRAHSREALGKELIEAIAFKMKKPTDVYNFEFEDGSDEFLFKANMSAFHEDDGFVAVYTFARDDAGFYLVDTGLRGS